MAETEELAPAPKAPTPQTAVSTGAGGPGFDIVSLWKAANGLAQSELMPEVFRGKPENCFLALEIAQRLGLGAFEVAQNMYPVHGSVGWKATYMIGLANARGEEVEEFVLVLEPGRD